MKDLTVFLLEEEDNTGPVTGVSNINFALGMGDENDDILENPAEENLFKPTKDVKV